MKKNKEDNLYLCFRYRCKQCPRQKKCEKEIEENKKQTCKNRR